MAFMFNFLAEQFLKQINHPMDISRRGNVNGLRCMTTARHALNEAAHHFGPMSNHGIEPGDGLVKNGQVRKQITSGFARSSDGTALPVGSRRPRWTIRADSRPRQPLDIR